MLKFDLITIFPRIFDSYFKESFIKKALARKLAEINIHNLRDYSRDRRKRVDDRPFGGGLGMVLQVEPIFRAIKKIKKGKKAKVILFTPRGKKFDQRVAYKLSQLDQIVMVCGRYEGVDERVKKLADMELSIGDYDLMGGELPALVVLETVLRLIPGVVGKSSFLKERITKGKGFIESVQYTRPEVFSPKSGIKWRVPKVLLSGNHKQIEMWRKKHGKEIGNLNKLKIY